MAYIKADAPTAMLTNNTSTCTKSLTISNVEVLIELFWLMHITLALNKRNPSCPTSRVSAESSQEKNYQSLFCPQTLLSLLISGKKNIWKNDVQPSETCKRFGRAFVTGLGQFSTETFDNINGT